jgi:hypothetical protein
MVVTEGTGDGCGSFSMSLGSVPVIRPDGSTGDLSDLTVGRRVTVYVEEGAVELQSCPVIVAVKRIVILK